jgi:plasmid replication initiation protein
MPKRNKLPAIPALLDSGNNPDELLVQKSNPLQSLSETSMTLPELKILDAYLARINSHNDDSRYVRFEKGELEKLLGVTRILKDDLSRRLDNLFVAITIRDEKKSKGFTKIGLFAKAEAEQDENGLWQVDLACTSEAMDYFFNVEKLGYFKYRLHNVVNLTSRYSYVLYLYLEKNRYRKTWKISLDELKQLLNCIAERYQQYKFFNAEILKKCQKELSEKTDISFSYSALNAKKQELKPRQKAVYVRFSVDTANDVDRNQLTFDDVNDKLGLLAEAVHNEFSPTQMNEIFETICLLWLPDSEDHGTDIARYHYLAKKYAKLNSADERNKLKGKPIKNRFNYFLKLIQGDIDNKDSTEKENVSDQSYDIDKFDQFAVTFSKNTKKNK